MLRCDKSLLAALGSILVVAGFAAADDRQADNKPVTGASGEANAVSGPAQFEALKKLAGVWKGKAAHGHGEPIDATVTYKVTGAGSALVETLFPGTDHEMLTVYHLDGQHLVLTHYCSAGNQPQMKALPGANAKKIEFRFSGGANIDPAKTFHMHDAALELVDADHLKAEWISHSNGKAAAPARFDLKRVKE